MVGQRRLALALQPEPDILVRGFEEGLIGIEFGRGQPGQPVTGEGAKDEVDLLEAAAQATKIKPLAAGVFRRIVEVRGSHGCDIAIWRWTFQ